MSEPVILRNFGGSSGGAPHSPSQLRCSYGGQGQLTGASVNLGQSLVPSARCGVPYSTRQDADAAAGAKAQNMAGLPELVFAHPDQKEFQRRVAALLEK